MVLCLFLCFVFLGCGPKIEEEFVRFGVYVENNSGQPVANVQVSFSNPQSGSDEERTDAAGCAVLGGINISKGEYKLKVSAEGYKPLDYTFSRETLNFIAVTLAEEGSQVNGEVEEVVPDALKKFPKCPEA
jgi:hypothetical protein